MHDFRLFYIITQKLKLEKIDWIAADSFGEVPNWKNTILITTQADLNKYHPNLNSNIWIVKTNLTQLMEEIFLNILKAINKIHHTKKILVALDPGLEESGVAIFLNDIFFFSKMLYTRGEIMRLIHEYLKYFPNCHRIIKIGHGYARNTRYLLNYFFSVDFKEPNVDFFLINEKASSKFIAENVEKDLSRHEMAAISIGLRKGIIITKKNYVQFFSNSIPNAAIRGIQSESRRIAHHHKKYYTITKEEAKKIYLGKKSVRQSIKESLESEDYSDRI